MKFWLTAVWLVFILVTVQAKDERLRLIHADLFKREQLREETFQILTGKVELRQGETTIKCDQAVQKLNAEIYELIGNVRIFDSENKLWADTVIVFEKEKRQVASGNVVNVTPDDTTTADRLIYFEESNRVLSQGNVAIKNPQKKTLLTGQWAEYFRDEDRGTVTDGAIFTQFDSLWNQQTQITADTMKIFGNSEQMEAVSSVTIQKARSHATCGNAKYFETTEQILMTENPVVLQENQEIRGDTLRMFLQDSKLVETWVRGNALAVSEVDTLNAGRLQNKLSGQSMRFSFEDEQITHALIENQATSIFHIVEDEDYKGINELSGDKIMVEFSDGKVQSVLVVSDPDVAVGSFAPAQ